MGYAGYAPGHRVAEQKTALERALDSVRNHETLDVVEKLTRNVCRDPNDEKYRRIRSSSATIKRLVFDDENALSVMLALGWRFEEGEREMTLSRDARTTMADVRAIDAARTSLRRRLEEEMHARIRERARAKDPAVQALREQMEADRGERSAREPVTEGSRAVERTSGRVVTASDVGASGSSGC
ncbi:hypothetical protein BE221DRAFT_193058 [Ostreococcus tauri]|uniref:PUB domain-containing protein n=1 Tax=Ostreococcus tauri TaxID=70448 RepID=A0A1Y5I7B5_OSTTA|nr:hypothetical protein BE221DRAFT_193058 [Ostreococcus tauri]